MRVDCFAYLEIFSVDKWKSLPVKEKEKHMTGSGRMYSTA